MQAATRAQGKLWFNDSALIATPDKLTAYLGDNGLEVLLNMGLFSVHTEESLI
jgi:hypothetical protein